MQYYAGIDLHSSNNFIVLINNEDKRLINKRLKNDLDLILREFEPYKQALKGIVVESTYNWYWLVDGLIENGYKVHLANPVAIQQYSGLKYTDDPWDSFWLAHLLRLNILPEGYIYPKEERPVRDLLRRRLSYVRNRTSYILSLISMISRNCGLNLKGNEIKKLTDPEIKELFPNSDLFFTAENCLNTIHFLGEIINNIEKKIHSHAKLREEFKLLKTIPGIGDILALTIMFEVGEICRFKNVGDYSSYCRCVASKKVSNNKNKGKGNKRNGNRYLGWAYIEAANYSKRFCDKANRFYQKKTASTNKIVAIKSLSNKLARASYFILRDRVPFDAEMLFG